MLPEILVAAARSSTDTRLVLFRVAEAAERSGLHCRYYSGVERGGT